MTAHHKQTLTQTTYLSAQDCTITSCTTAMHMLSDQEWDLFAPLKVASEKTLDTSYHLELHDNEAVSAHILELAHRCLLDKTFLSGHEQIVTLLKLVYRQHSCNAVSLLDG